MDPVRRLAAAVGLFLCLFFLVTQAIALPADLATLPDDKKAEMADSYYLAGLQYREVGKNELADGMIRLAFSLNPALDPESIVYPKPRVITAPDLAPPTEPADTTSWTSSLAVSQMLRLASAFLAHDADAIVDMLDGSVYVAGMNVTRAQAHASLAALFERQSLAGISLSHIYDINSVAVKPYALGTRGALAEAFEVSVDALMDLSAYVPFWGTEQRFVLRPMDNSWLVSAVLFSNEQRVPASWSPAVESTTAANQRLHTAAKRKRDIAERMAVVLALLDGADGFLNKDPNGVLAAMDRQVLLPDGSAVTRESLRTTLDQYFAGTPYRGLRARDIIKVDSVEHLGPSEENTYRVDVSFEDRYQEALPSIRSEQSFHLRYADGRWVVFAIS